MINNFIEPGILEMIFVIKKMLESETMLPSWASSIITCVMLGFSDDDNRFCSNKMLTPLVMNTQFDHFLIACPITKDYQ